MKKFFAIMAAGVMTCAMALCAFAANSPTTTTVAPAAPAVAPAQDNIPTAVVAAAQSEAKTVEEYVNNAIASTPGMAQTTVIAQGGKSVINGVQTNLTFVLKKADKATVNYAKALGNVMAVFNMKAPCKFTDAIVPIYAKGVVAGQVIKAYQLQNGVWVEIPAAVRADHVDVTITMAGPIVFIAG